MPYFLCSFLQRQFLCSQGIFYDMKVLSKVHCSHGFLSWKCSETQVSLYFLFRQEVAQNTEFGGHFSRYESIRVLISCIMAHYTHCLNNQGFFLICLCKNATSCQTGSKGKFEFLGSCSLRNHDCSISYYFHILQNDLLL